MRSDDMGVLMAHAERQYCDHVDESAGPRGCWPWVGPRNRPADRFPIFYLGMTTTGAPVQRNVMRLAYLYANGPESLDGQERLDVTCGQEVCCNPSHLRRHRDVLAEEHDCAEHQTPAGACGRCQGRYDQKSKRTRPAGKRRCPRCNTMRERSTFRGKVCGACEQAARRARRRSGAGSVTP